MSLFRLKQVYAMYALVYISEVLTLVFDMLSMEIDAKLTVGIIFSATALIVNSFLNFFY